MSGECENCGEHCLDCICEDKYVCPDPLKTLKAKINILSENERLILKSLDNYVSQDCSIKPLRCQCIHAIDGYETYKIDDYTISVRPIWWDVDVNPPNCYRLLMTYNDLVMEGEYGYGKFYHPSGCTHNPDYCKCEEQEGITHWMPLPQAPND